jgi:hypothetical protein
MAHYAKITCASPAALGVLGVWTPELEHEVVNHAVEM